MILRWFGVLCGFCWLGLSVVMFLCLVVMYVAVGTADLLLGFVSRWVDSAFAALYGDF